jgi:glycosyltransferase involved in cell wall biosynthesis
VWLLTSTCAPSRSILLMTSVGIVIPAYNPVAGHFERALESVLNQTYRDWRCVIVDDGSDAPLAIEPSLTDHRLSMLRQENRGVSAARNAGVAAVQTTYVAFLDQDDEWLPEKLERQIAFMRRHDLALSDTDFNILRFGRNIASGYEWHQGSFCRLLSTAGMGLSTMMVRRDVLELLGGFNGAFRIVQDWELALRIAYAGHRFDRLHEVLCCYHLHEENASRDYRAAYREAIAVLALYANLDTRPEVRAAAKIGQKRVRELYAYKAIDAFRVTRRKQHLAWAATHAPPIAARAVFTKVPSALTSRRD